MHNQINGWWNLITGGLA